MRAATVVQWLDAVDGHDVRQGRRATAGGTGQLAGVTPRSRLPSQCSAAESWAATAIDRSWRRRTTVAALISIFVVATTKCCLL